MRKLKIIGVNIFLERRRTRLHVGVLEKVKDKLVFTYDNQYFKAKNVISLGPEFPLTQRQFSSDRLFPSFEDRIPSKQNPAYPDYCHSMGIDPNEQDPFILLSTIGQKGPSSFIFSPIFERKYTSNDLVEFRTSLGLTTREFASVFEFSQTSLNAFEGGRISGKDIQKRFEILYNYPVVALDLLVLNRGYLVYNKWFHAMEKLKSEKKSD